ncbi:MAG: TetR/AcrR family transcriptional regulator [Halioglobus sp.]|nr:TetR/AcrR family transcriptional regulator [Halioglobus sp.]
MANSATTTAAVPSTAERILDAAEDLFAEKGYSATSLGDVADRVGIRSPSLYNHFKNKEALYEAVLERLLADFSAPLAELNGGPVTNERVFSWLETIVRQHHANPNLARLLQHAALSGGPHTNELIDRLFRPMFQSDARIDGDSITLFRDTGLQPWAVMAFNNLVMSYVTMAPMYRDLLGQDPFSEEALENQLNLIKMLLLAVFEYKGSSPSAT